MGSSSEPPGPSLLVVTTMLATWAFLLPTWVSVTDASLPVHVPTMPSMLKSPTSAIRSKFVSLAALTVMPVMLPSATLRVMEPST